MDIVLPKEIAYSPSLPTLPECISQEIVLSPVNGASFEPSTLVQFDIPSRGFIDPTSIYLRYKTKVYTAAAGGRAQVRGTPVYAPLAKLETMIGPTIYESITNYNQVMNMWCNIQYDQSQKYGMQSAFGYKSQNAVPTLEEFDGRYCDATVTVGSDHYSTYSVAGPIACLLSSAEKLVPVGFMPQIRIQFTTESIANLFHPTAAAAGGVPAIALPSNYKLENVELCYTMIDFAGGVNDLVKNMGEKFYLKTQSFQNMGASLAANATGSLEIVYNMRLASIKSLFCHFCTTATTAVNGIFDSLDPTSSNGDLQFNVAGTYYPSRSVSTLNNKASVLMELKKAVGALHSDNFNTSINSVEFEANAATTTTPVAPGKFYFGKRIYAE